MNLFLGRGWGCCRRSGMRPSAGIGVVEVQELFLFFCVFVGARATLCEDRRGRGAKTRGLFFAILRCPDEPSAEIGVVEVQKLEVFLRFLRCPRDPLRGSAWSRAAALRVARSRVLLVRGSSGCRFCSWSYRNVLRVLLFYLQFSILRDWSCGNVLRVLLVYLKFATFSWSCGNVLRVLLLYLKFPIFSLVRGVQSRSSGCKIANYKYKSSTQSTVPQLWQHLRRATCTKQLAQSNLRRATCKQCTCAVEQLAQSNSRRATCIRTLAQSNLRRATCAEQLAQSNLHTWLSMLSGQSSSSFYIKVLAWPRWSYYGSTVHGLLHHLRNLDVKQSGCL